MSKVIPIDAGAEEQVAIADALVLDVRDTPMPGQAGMTLAALESLEPGRGLLHVNAFVPWFLFPMLETRGIRYRIQSSRPGATRILMWRHREAFPKKRQEANLEVVRAP